MASQCRGLGQRRIALVATLGFARQRAGLFLTLALSAPSAVSGAIADTRGSLPNDGAVNRDCELLATLGFIAAIIADTFR